MATGLPRASLLERTRFALTYALPSLLRGALIPQPFWTELVTRLNTGRWAVATVERLSARSGGRSLLLGGVLGETLLILTTDDVRRVLDSPVEVFALDAREKQRALEPFAPDALNGSPPSLRVQRRPFNEAVLDFGREPHRFAERFLEIVGQEITAMLATAGDLDYERSLAGFRRISRRCVLGDAAADDTQLSEEHGRLREEGNWLGLKVWNRRRNATLRASMDERIRRYVDAAEPGTLVSLFPSAPQAHRTHPNGQVPFWLMALDAVRIVVANTLALLATHPAARARAVEEIATADAAHGRGTVAGLADLRFVRACVQESIRLWPAAPTLVRRTTTDTEWHGTTVRAGTRVLIPAAVFHRARRLPYANRLAPEIWLDGSADSDWSLNLFSRGGAQCAGRNLALVLATATLAELLRQAEFELLKPKLSPDRPLPYLLNPLTTRFTVKARSSSVGPRLTRPA
ncbi:MAG TPA: cytochrome P450 [Candidatus Angelobacter sp.]|nr:cytochrome P450 [Candidatus Angelobacter sp.]